MDTLPLELRSEIFSYLHQPPKKPEHGKVMSQLLDECRVVVWFKYHHEKKWLYAEFSDDMTNSMNHDITMDWYIAEELHREPLECAWGHASPQTRPTPALETMVRDYCHEWLE